MIERTELPSCRLGTHLGGRWVLGASPVHSASYAARWDDNVAHTTDAAGWMVLRECAVLARRIVCWWTDCVGTVRLNRSFHVRATASKIKAWQQAYLTIGATPAAWAAIHVPGVCRKPKAFLRLVGLTTCTRRRTQQPAFCSFCCLPARLLVRPPVRLGPIPVSTTANPFRPSFPAALLQHPRSCTRNLPSPSLAHR